jgi:hypothetical protein
MWRILSGKRDIRGEIKVDAGKRIRRTLSENRFKRDGREAD